MQPPKNLLENGIVLLLPTEENGPIFNFFFTIMTGHPIGNIFVLTLLQFCARNPEFFGRAPRRFLEMLKQAGVNRG